MDELLPNPDSASGAPPTVRMSFFARLLNVFAIPGDVFQDVKTSPKSVANWLIPILISAVVGSLSAIVIFSQPNIQQQIKEAQAKTFDQQVKEKKITREQADQMVAMTEKFTGPAMMKTIGVIGSSIASFVRVFWWGLVIYLIGQWFLKVRIPYLKAVEVAGLSIMIAVLGAVVALLLVVNLEKLTAGPNLGLAVKDFDMNSKGHLALGAANIFSFWFVTVISIGLSRLAEVPLARALFLVFGYWVLQEFLLIGIGMGQMAL
ncbi:MAG: YIP1 family protein [Verrucomicrobiota bacterium]